MQKIWIAESAVSYFDIMHIQECYEQIIISLLNTYKIPKAQIYFGLGDQNQPLNWGWFILWHGL